MDYWAFLAAIFPFVFWGFYLYDRFAVKSESQNLLYGALIVTGISLAVFAWRYLSILSFYGGGVETQATVNRVGFFRDRGSIAYIYTFEGQKYLCQNTVMKTGRTKSYRIGEEITVLVDRNNPKRAIIRDLYV